MFRRPAVDRRASSWRVSCHGKCRRSGRTRDGRLERLAPHRLRRAVSTAFAISLRRIPARLAARRARCTSATKSRLAGGGSRARWAIAGAPTPARSPTRSVDPFEIEVVRHANPWRSVDDVEYATLEWVAWFDNCLLLEPLGYPPLSKRGPPARRARRLPPSRVARGLALMSAPADP